MPSLRSKPESLVTEMTNKHENPLLVYSIHMAYCRINEYRGREGTHPICRPIWIIIVDGYCNIIYESFVRYPHVDFMDTKFHGLSYRDIKNAKNLASIRDQVIGFLATASTIVGSGLINGFKALDLKECEIDFLRPKCREITQHFSPYRTSPASLALISFLVFGGFTIKGGPHSPGVEAITSMKLYMAFWNEVEDKCKLIEDGIHNGNTISTCNNAHVARLHRAYSRRVEEGKAYWPNDWSYYCTFKERKLPNFDSNMCASPSEGSVASTSSSYNLVEVDDDGVNLPADQQPVRLREEVIWPDERPSSLSKALVSSGLKFIEPSHEIPMETQPIEEAKAMDDPSQEIMDFINENAKETIPDVPEEWIGFPILDDLPEIPLESGEIENMESLSTPPDVIIPYEFTAELDLPDPLELPECSIPEETTAQADGQVDPDSTNAEVNPEGTESPSVPSPVLMRDLDQDPPM